MAKIANAHLPQIGETTFVCFSHVLGCFQAGQVFNWGLNCVEVATHLQRAVVTTIATTTTRFCNRKTIFITLKVDFCLSIFLF